MQVRLQLSRTDGPVKPMTGEIFGVLELVRPSSGEVLSELASDLWTLRTDFVWGAFWTVLLPPATGLVRFCVHRSLIFTEPLLGCVELALHELPPESAGERLEPRGHSSGRAPSAAAAHASRPPCWRSALCTQWHPLRAKGAAGSSEILGEVRAPRRAPPRPAAPRRAPPRSAVPRTRHITSQVRAHPDAARARRGDHHRDREAH